MFCTANKIQTGLHFSNKIHQVDLFLIRPSLLNPNSVITHERRTIIEEIKEYWIRGLVPCHQRYLFVLVELTPGPCILVHSL